MIIHEQDKSKGLCVLCLRKCTQLLYYRLVTRGEKHSNLVQVYGNISNQEIFQFFPEEVRKTQTAAWELVFLLLLSNERDDDAEVIQALLDTGISPRKGLIAYMRLFKRVSDRTAVLSEVPPYRRIQSVDRDFES